MLYKLIFMSLLCTAVFGSKLPNEKPFYDIELARDLFADFIETYNKVYETEEEYQYRYNIFLENLKTINDLNAQHEQTTFGTNKYSDIAPEEMSRLMGFIPSALKTNSVPDYFNQIEDIPDSVDWRKKNVVNPVKSQGTCGSCWAFSAVALIESQYAIKYNELKSLSEQQLVDCDYDDYGCDGGDEYSAVSYAAGCEGMMLESDYPYDPSINFDCKYRTDKFLVKVKNATNYNTTEEQMKIFLASYGPVSISFYASPQFNFYKSGVLSPTDCGDVSANHAVAIVGYGTDNGTDYWIIRNSWGTSFGENGYFRLVRGKGVCRVSEDVTLAEVA